MAGACPAAYLGAYWFPKPEKERAAEDLREALIDLRDAERSVERAKQRVEAARIRLNNAE